MMNPIISDDKLQQRQGDLHGELDDDNGLENLFHTDLQFTMGGTAS